MQTDILALSRHRLLALTHDELLDLKAFLLAVVVLDNHRKDALPPEHFLAHNFPLQRRLSSPLQHLLLELLVSTVVVGGGDAQIGSRFQELPRVVLPEEGEPSEVERLVMCRGEAGRYFEEVDEVMPQLYHLAAYQVALVQHQLHCLLPAPLLQQPRVLSGFNLPSALPSLSFFPSLFLEESELAGVDQ